MARWNGRLALLALLILIGFALLDLMIYRLVGDVTVCYRCRAQYRGAARSPDHHPFDLGIGERFRQEQIRLAALARAWRMERWASSCRGRPSQARTSS